MTLRTSDLILRCAFFIALLGAIFLMKRYALLAAWIYDPLERDCPVGQVIFLNKKKNLALVKHGHKLYFVCRGTSLRYDPVGDLLSDTALFFGNLEFTPRFDELERALKPHLKQKQNIVLIGHSLGGTLATEMGLKYTIESQTFNSGRSPFCRLKYGRKRHPRSREYRNAFDVVSLLNAFDPHTTTVHHDASHSISTFT